MYQQQAYKTVAKALNRLRRGSTVLEAALETGLSGPGRLHDLMITTEALSPGEVRRLGEGVEIHYGTGDTPFGQAVLAWTERGINFLGFCQDVGQDAHPFDQGRAEEAGILPASAMGYHYDVVPQVFRV